MAYRLYMPGEAEEEFLVPNESIAQAITRFARHVRDYKHLVVSDHLRPLSHDDVAQHAAAVDALCDELDALAHRSELTAVSFADFEAVRLKLYSLNAVAPLGHLNAVQDAFVAWGRL